MQTRPRARLHSSEPNHGTCEMDEAHECGKRLLAAQGDAAEALEPIEETFDLMALLVERPVDRMGALARRVALNLRGCAEIIGDEGAQGIAVVGGVGDDVVDARQPLKKTLRLRAVPALAGRWSHTKR